MQNASTRSQATAFGSPVSPSTTNKRRRTTSANGEDVERSPGKSPGIAAPSEDAAAAAAAKPAAVNKKWTGAEDTALLGLVAASGAGDWAAKAAALPGVRRSGEAVRLRYSNHLRPEGVSAVSDKKWTGAEDTALLGLVAASGAGDWAAMTHSRSF
jgi:hypothetical protein